ncbi:MAG TPA: hypothetical protein VF666_16080 [Pyrinomonadaceae bacterium]|jgi:hypothetical protein
MNIPNDLINVREARALLGISPAKMARLLRDGVLTVYEDKLDARLKLVSEAEVQSLKIRRPKAA